LSTDCGQRITETWVFEAVRLARHERVDANAQRIGQANPRADRHDGQPSLPHCRPRAKEPCAQPVGRSPGGERHKQFLVDTVDCLILEIPFQVARVAQIEVITHEAAVRGQQSGGEACAAATRAENEAVTHDV
jgi:hypothetical protein